MHKCCPATVLLLSISFHFPPSPIGMNGNHSPIQVNVAGAQSNSATSLWCPQLLKKKWLLVTSSAQSWILFCCCCVFRACSSMVCKGMLREWSSMLSTGFSSLHRWCKCCPLGSPCPIQNFKPLIGSIKVSLSTFQTTPRRSRIYCSRDALLSTDSL